MWMTPHTLVGVTIVNTINEPALSLPLAYLSHYAMDFVPHWTQKPSFKGKGAIALYIDFFIALSIGLYVALRNPFLSTQFFIVIAGAALANLPDAVRIPLLLKKGELTSLKESRNPLERLHEMLDQDLSPDNGTIFKFLKGNKLVGIGIQIVVVVVCLVVLL